MSYSAVTDLMVGDIPLPSYLSPQKYVDDAADEMDSHIGFLYQTPIDITDVETNPVSRPVRLLLKRISVHLSTGRILMAIAAPTEDSTVHAYGYHMVKDALDALKSISDGAIALDGATSMSTETNATTAPLISNLDPESMVEAFYNRVVNPNVTASSLGINL